MSRFLVDAQLPPALAGWFVQRGHHAEHVMELGLAGASDKTIWQRAQETRASIITKDEDFFLRSTLAPSSPTIVWVRLGNCRNAALFAAFEKALPSIELAVAADERIVELV